MSKNKSYYEVSVCNSIVYSHSGHLLNPSPSPLVASPGNTGTSSSQGSGHDMVDRLDLDNAHHQQVRQKLRKITEENMRWVGGSVGRWVGG